MQFLNGYFSSRWGLLVLAFTAAGFVMFLHRGEQGGQVVRPGARGGPDAPPTEKSAERICSDMGWPKRALSVPGMLPGLPRLLPGAFPPVGATLPPEGRGLVSLKKELEIPGLPRVRRADVTMRLARGYAIRALYFRARLTGSAPGSSAVSVAGTRPGHRRQHRTSGRVGKGSRGRRRRDRHRRRSVGPFARPMSREALLRGYRVAIRASDFYYRDLMSRKFRRQAVVLDRVLYEHASLLLLAGRPGRAVEELENLVTSVPESRFATYARAAIAVASARKGECARAIRLVAKLQLDSLGLLGALAGLAAGRCMLSGKDPARAIGWLVRVVQGLEKGTGGRPHGDDGHQSHLVLLGACRVLARALSQSSDPESAGRRAMSLPQPASAFVLSELRRIYRKNKRFREEILLCRLAGVAMAKQSGPAAAKAQQWSKESRKLPGLGPVDLQRGRKRRGRRAAGVGRTGAATQAHGDRRGQGGRSAVHRPRRPSGGSRRMVP